MSEPILRWAGSKRWAVELIVPQVPKYNRYFEPFCGAAHFFFALKPERALISDLNPLLINAYRELVKDASALIQTLLHLPISPEVYYRVRHELYQTRSLRLKAAYFLYLNKNCWNGLYRENKFGRFNVPFGRPNRKGTRPQVDVEGLLAASETFRVARLEHGDFRAFTKFVRTEDLVYLDPPYKIGQSRRAFSEYTSDGFTIDDEIRLAKNAIELAHRGAHVIVSHACSSEARHLYEKHFEVSHFWRSQTISGLNTGRRQTEEVVFSTFPLSNVPERDHEMPLAPVGIEGSVAFNGNDSRSKSFEITTGKVAP